jgi:hypothetical protein
MSSSSFDIVLTSVTRSSTSCAKSLSPVEITARQPSRFASSASVAMTSSASTPSMTSTGQPSAATASCSGATCTPRSSGMGVRFALYSAYSASRKVLPLASNTQASAAGL